MRFNKHYALEGRHAFISASKYHWIRYDDAKFDQTYRTAMAAQRGSEIHEFGFNAIRLGIKLPKSPKTINMYVNDAIGFRMSPEIVLSYSETAFGTVDAISFRDNFLRIHDLKTGVNNTSFDQLLIYCAFFCLEYGIKPGEIKIELRIYQNDEIKVMIPDIVDIINIMDKIVKFDQRIQDLRREND